MYYLNNYQNEINKYDNIILTNDSYYIFKPLDKFKTLILENNDSQLIGLALQMNKAIIIPIF